MPKHFERQPGDADKSRFARFHDAAQRRKRFLDNLRQIAKFDVMALNDVHEIHAQAIQTLIHALANARGGKIEAVEIGAVATDFDRQNKFLARNAAQGASQHGFGFGEAVIRRAIQKIDAPIECAVEAAFAIGIADLAKHAAKRRGAQRQRRNLKTSAAQNAKFHE